VAVAADTALTVATAASACFWADKKKKRANRSSDWNQLFESDRKKKHELVIAYINGGMMAAEAKSQVWLKDKGFSMPKP
jgi:hypothetical protein